MNGLIAQVIAIVIHANAYLQGRDLGAFWSDATVFKFCDSVSFLWADKHENDPQGWLREIKASSMGLWLRVLPRPYGPGNESRWLIEAVGPRRSTLWEPTWAVMPSRDTANSRPWLARYKENVRSAGHPFQPNRALAPLRAEFEDVLVGIADFCRAQKIGFAESFDAARATLHAENPIATYYADIVPTGFLPRAELQLLCAAQAAWVFGGMGSWNDNIYPDETQRGVDTWGERLMRVIEECFTATANSTAIPQPKGVK